MAIYERVLEIRRRAEDALTRSGRASGDVRILAATKLADPRQIKEAISAGIMLIGESRVQDALEKFGKLQSGIEKHFIGTLQSNKIKSVVQHFDAIESVDSLKLARQIDEECSKIGKIMPIFAEINIGKEESKHGVYPEDTLDFCNNLLELQNLRLAGLMCILPYFDDAEIGSTREYFREMAELKKKTGTKLLSMGMSNDFEIAIEGGSNIVRIGRGIFG